MSAAAVWAAKTRVELAHKAQEAGKVSRAATKSTVAWMSSTGVVLADKARLAGDAISSRGLAVVLVGAYVVRDIPGLYQDALSLMCPCPGCPCEEKSTS